MATRPQGKGAEAAPGVPASVGARLLEVRRLSVTIAGRTVCAGLDLAVDAGQCWSVLGINGVGKTTLLHTLAGLRRADDGAILLCGAPVAHLPRRAVARQMGLLFQNREDAFPGTVLETALLGRHPHLRPWQWESEEDFAIARHALADVGLEEAQHRALATLSGGERQRLALATLLTQSPRVALLDEPANHLDLHHQIQLLGLLAQRARAQGGALLMTLHDINLAARFSTHVLLLFGNGLWQAGPSTELLTVDRLQRLYGQPLTALAGPHGPAFLAL